VPVGVAHTYIRIHTKPRTHHRTVHMHELSFHSFKRVEVPLLAKLDVSIVPIYLHYPGLKSIPLNLVHVFVLLLPDFENVTRFRHPDYVTNIIPVRSNIVLFESFQYPDCFKILLFKRRTGFLIFLFPDVQNIPVFRFRYSVFRYSVLRYSVFGIPFSVFRSPVFRFPVFRFPAFLSKILLFL
jgi:hypothetical protein